MFWTTQTGGLIQIKKKTGLDYVILSDHLILFFLWTARFQDLILHWINPAGLLLNNGAQEQMSVKSKTTCKGFKVEAEASMNKLSP